MPRIVKMQIFEKGCFFIDFWSTLGCLPGAILAAGRELFRKNDPELYLSGFFATPFLRWFFERFRTPKGSPNDVKMSPKTVLFCFRRNLVFEQHYNGLAYISWFQGSRNRYGSVRKTHAEKGSQKIHINTAPVDIFRKTSRPAAKMAPGRHPKVDQKSMKKHIFSKICIFTILDTHFSVPKGSGGTPFAAKTKNFDKKH